MGQGGREGEGGGGGAGLFLSGQMQQSFLFWAPGFPQYLGECFKYNL